MLSMLIRLPSPVRFPLMTLGGTSGNARNDGAPAAAAPRPIRFVRASRQRASGTPLDKTQILAAGQAALDNADIVTNGYLRGIRMNVATTVTGVIGAGVANADYPFSTLGRITLSDIGGVNLAGPFTGYDLFLVNKYGGFFGAGSDPTGGPNYNASNVIPNFDLYVPVEIGGRDALGALPNTDVTSAFKLAVDLAAIAGAYSTPPTTAPTLRVRAVPEYWSQPAPSTFDGQAQEVRPPFTAISRWSKQAVAVQAGNPTVPVRLNLGDHYRMMIIVKRDATGVRAATLPDPLILTIDGQTEYNLPLALVQRRMFERYGFSTVESGVAVLDFASDFSGRVGWEMRDDWIPTTPGTSIEISGAQSASGTLETIVNTVAAEPAVFVA